LRGLRSAPTKSQPPRKCGAVMGPGGLEPPTSPLSGVRSNQLSYEPGTVGCAGRGIVAKTTATARAISPRPEIAQKRLDEILQRDHTKWSAGSVFDDAHRTALAPE
jgi:hypothetical protein